MNANELIERIRADRQEGAGEKVERADRIVKFLIFSIGEKRYALYAEEVREIVLDLPLYFVPFVPAYVRGFINRHGEPYTVVDPSVLFAQERNDSKKYLILNIRGDQLAFMISDIHEILKVPESEVHPITAKEEETGFFLGSVTLSGAEIFILNLESMLQRLEYDFESA